MAGKTRHIDGRAQFAGKAAGGQIVGGNIQRQAQILGPARGGTQGRHRDMAGKRHDMVGALGHGKQSGSTNAAQAGMIPPRQRLGTAQNIAFRTRHAANAELRLKHHLDLVAINGAQQIGLQLGRGGAGMGGLAAGPHHAAPLLMFGESERLRQPIEHGFGIFIRQRPQQRETG